MQKRPFVEIIRGADMELRRPAATPEHANEMFRVLKANDFFYPWRFSLRDCKSPDDCMRLIEKRLAGIAAMTDDYYDIFVADAYVGEVYARDIDYETGTVNNLGYFVDGKMRGRGVASSAVLTLESELWKMGVQKIFLFCHFFDEKELNFASERVAKKCGYEFLCTKDRAIYDKWGDRWAGEHQFVKTAPDDL
jgi:RimJ/RimL family protein N-acetyltransferase